MNKRYVTLPAQPLPEETASFEHGKCQEKTNNVALVFSWLILGRPGSCEELTRLNL